MESTEQPQDPRESLQQELMAMGNFREAESEGTQSVVTAALPEEGGDQIIEGSEASGAHDLN